MAQRTASLASIVLLLAVGCNTPAQTQVDGGGGGIDAPITPPDAYLAPDSCDPDHIHPLEGVAGGMVSIDFDTTMTTTRPRDLGEACGNTAADIRWAPQEVVAFHVPGTGMQGVQFSTDNAMTTLGFNTLVQVRQGSCRTVPTTSFPPSCFDDISTSNLASSGGITVMGGSMLYFIVTGYSDPPAGEMAVDRGHVHVTFTVSPNSAPVLMSGYSVFSNGDTLVQAVATDAEGPIAGFSLAFYNAMGQIDINGDGTANDQDVLTLNFDSVDRAAPMYTGHSSISGTTMYQLATYCHQAAVACTQIGLRVFDAQFAVSNLLMVPAADASVVGVGATCDTLHLCADGLMCTSGSCAALPAATAECAAAIEFPITTPTVGTPTMAAVAGTTTAGTGVFAASCAATTGKEVIYHMTIPAGTYDLALTTAPGTATTSDTVLYIRSACVDATTELMGGCNDDIMYPANVRSAFTITSIPPGDYYIFVEAFGTGAVTPFTLTATLTAH